MCYRKNSCSLEPEKATLVDQNYNAKIQQITHGNGKNLAQVPKKKTGSPYRQILAALVAQLGTINTGMAFGFSAIAIPQLEDVNSTILINEDEKSWIGIFVKIIMSIGIFRFFLVENKCNTILFNVSSLLQPACQLLELQSVVLPPVT